MAKRGFAPGRAGTAGPEREQWQLKLFGRASASFAGKQLTLANRKGWALIGYLALSDAAGQTRERLIGALWSDSSEERARASLRQALYEARAAFEAAGQDILLTSKSSVALDRDRLSTDVWTVVAEAKQGHIHPLLLETERIADTLLADLDNVDPEFGNWLVTERQSVNDQLVRYLTETLRSATGPARGELARALLNLDATNEEAVRTLMRASAEGGDIGGALGVYKRLWDLLAEEFDVEPSKETQDLVAAIKLAQPDPSRPAARDTMPITVAYDLGAMHGPATLAIFVRGASDQQTGIVDQLIETHRQRGIRPLPMPQERAWLLEAPSAGEVARLAFEVQDVCRAMPQGGPEVLMGAHVSSSRQGGSPRLHRALAEIAGPGGVATTDNFRERLMDGVDATVRDLGFVQAPQLGEQLRAFTVSPPESTSSPALADGSRLRPAIAVLPFELAAAGDDDRATLGELLAEEVIGALSQARDLDVISRLSSRNLSLRRFGIGEIGARLQADYVLTGVARTGKSHELVFELTETGSMALKWRQQREVQAPDTERARALAEWVAAEVKASILVSESERAAANPLPSLQAYTILFAGITLMDRWTRMSFDRSRELLTALHERTPSHPLPNAWLAAWHIRSISQGWTQDATADGTAAIEYAQRSLDADPHCSLALAMDGWANVHVRRRLDVALDRLSLAVECNPNDSLAWLLKGVTHAFAGEGYPGVDATQRALRLSPLDPRRSYYEAMAASAELAAGNYDRVIEFATRSLRANRLHASTLRALAVAQWLSGRQAEARQTIADLLALDPSFRVSRYLAIHPAKDNQIGRTIAETLSAAGVPL